MPDKKVNIEEVKKRLDEAARSNHKIPHDDDVQALLADHARLEKIIAVHKIYHDVVGCPGLPECYVCAAEVAAEKERA